MGMTGAGHVQCRCAAGPVATPACICLLAPPVQRIRQLRQELDKQRQRAEAAETMAAAADQAAAALDVKAERVQRFQVSKQSNSVVRC